MVTFVSNSIRGNIATRRLYFGGKVIGGKLRNLSLEVSQQCLGGKSKVRGVSRIYLQVLEVKSLAVIYRQAHWRYFTSGTETPPKGTRGVFIGWVGPPPLIVVVFLPRQVTRAAPCRWRCGATSASSRWWASRRSAGRAACGVAGRLHQGLGLRVLD